MLTETNISLPSKLFRGNNLDIECQVNVDLDGYTITAELFDRFYSSISLSSDVLTEIEIVDEEDGTFTIHVEKDLTTLFHLVSYLEITLTDEDGKEQTIWFDVLKFEDNVYLRA
jgi:hypothetical protein